MNLKDRLKELESHFSVPEQREMITYESCGIESLIDGSFYNNEYGSCFVVSEEYPLTFKHGFFELGRFRDIRHDVPETLALKKFEGTFNPEKTLFLDTETTGLSGGTGTYAFLVGMGYLKGDAFVIEQLFQTDFSDEAAQLTLLTERLRNFDTVCTYNGKSFDIPLLVTRLRFNRFENNLSGMRQIDLLHAARRILKKRLSEISLGRVEGEVLGVFRGKEDVPGWQIPSLYFDYLRTRDAKLIRNVFYHNRIDVLSLASLLIWGSSLFEKPKFYLKNPFDVLSVGKVFDCMKDYEESRSVYELAGDMICESELKKEIQWRCSMAYKRCGDYNRALEIWKNLFGDRRYGLQSAEELAKYYEHLAHDFDSALKVVEHGLKRITIVSELGQMPVEKAFREFMKRKKRLEHKLRRYSD